MLAFRQALVGQPALLPALGTRVPAVVVQDSARVLHYVSAENAVLWSDTLSGPAVGLSLLPAGGGVSGGLLLGAGAQVHLLAADGAPVVPFPLHLPDTVRVADLLAMSQRTLSRHLQDEGTTLSRIVEQVRIEHAERLLLGSRKPVQEVARQVGFTDASSFSRAFRRATGLTPMALREQRTTTETTESGVA